MSEETNTTDEQQNSGETTAQENDETKAETFSREYVEELRKESARYRTEAKETKARLEELQAGKEEATSAVTEKEQALTSAQIDVLKYKLALKHGLTVDDADLFLTGSNEETLEKQATALSERTVVTQTSRVLPDPSQGRRSETGSLSNADAFAQALESN